MDPIATLRAAYAAFNRRDLDAALALLTDDVDWPNLLDATRAHGRPAVRAYWERQFARFSPTVTPTAFTVDGDTVTVTVHQQVHALDGTLLKEATVAHRYTLRAGLIARMDVLDTTPARG